MLNTEKKTKTRVLLLLRSLSMHTYTMIYDHDLGKEIEILVDFCLLFTTVFEMMNLLIILFIIQLFAQINVFKNL